MIINETGCEKLNVIAHSKGGIDVREAIAKHEVGKYIASVTTINTPHKGCAFADYLLDKIPKQITVKAAEVYNKMAMVFGDSSPDFLGAVNDLRQSVCIKRHDEMCVPKEIFCQSVGSIQKKWCNGKFPLNMSYNFVKYFDGENDGLVSENSFEWGERYILIRPKGNRGISHADMIDLNRENIEGFDVREFYVELVSDLKNRGL